jgi:hypothetical protein
MSWWEGPKERDHSEDRGVDGRMGSEWILRRLAGGWSEFSWLRIGTGSRLLNLQFPGATELVS